MPPKSNLLSAKSRAAIQSARQEYTDTIHGNTAPRLRKKMMERNKVLEKASNVVVQLVWLSAVMLLLISSLRNPKSKTRKLCAVDARRYCEGKSE